MSDFHPQREYPQNLHSEPAHEHFELKLRGVVIFLVSLVTITVVVLLIGIFVMKFFAHVEEKDQALRPALFQDDTGQFPGPRLEETPRIDLAHFREGERKKAESYGWVDGKGGIARIPIDRAIDLLAERGLPKGRNTPPRGSRTRDQK